MNTTDSISQKTRRYLVVRQWKKDLGYCIGSASITSSKMARVRVWSKVIGALCYLWFELYQFWKALCLNFLPLL
jgi:hypothetical protein